MTEKRKWLAARLVREQGDRRPFEKILGVSVDETPPERYDRCMDKHIEQALVKLEALRDAQALAGDVRRAAQTDHEIKRIEKRMVYR